MRGVMVSDAERDRVVARLGDHAVAGRLTFDELELRVGRALAARTRPDLDAALRGLPRRGARLAPALHGVVFVATAVVLIAAWEIEREAMGPDDSALGYFWPFWILAAWLGAAAVRHVRRGRPPTSRRALSRG
jgi:Domain of unknown function (DUF1707)